MVKFGNFYYFLFIFLAIIIWTIFYFLFRNKSQKVQYKVLLILSILNIILHFSKILFEPYFSQLPGSIRKITFENICACSTLIMPFVLLIRKNKWLNNYFFFIGLAGGIGALFYPTEALNKTVFTFDVLRFYYCHITLCLIPALAGSWRLYVPEYKKFYQIPLMFLTIETLILINEFILYKVGIGVSSITDFFSTEVRNSSFVFGPTPELYEFSKKTLLIFVPKIFTMNVFDVPGLTTLYWPVIWLIIPCFIYFPIVYELLVLPFTFKDIKNDIIALRMKKETT